MAREADHQLAITVQQTPPNNGQNAPPTSPPKQVTLELHKHPAMAPEADQPATIPGQQQPANKSQNASTNEQKQGVTLDLLRKYILLLASLVATVTYAAAFSPPGDVWQDTSAGHLAGDPIIRETHHKRYLAFYYCNATAFAASLVVIVSILILAYLEDKQLEGDTAEPEDKPQQDPNSNGDKQQAETNSEVDKKKPKPWKKHTIALRTLQAAMVLDLLSLMGAYAAGTCRDTFTTIVYSSVLVGLVLIYVVGQVVVPPKVQVEAPQLPDMAALASVPGNNPQSSSSGSVLTVVEQDVGSSGGVAEAEMAALASARRNSPQFSSGENEEEEQKPKNPWTRSKARVVGIGKVGAVHTKVRQDKADERFRKVLMLLATFAVSITYTAGLNMPGGFWDSTGAGHGPGDPILKDRHSTRLAVFLGFNTIAFVASLLIIVVLLDKNLRRKNAYGFIVVALLSLIGAYNAGSCRETDTTVYVAGLIPAVAACILLLYMVAGHIYTKWEAMEEYFKGFRTCRLLCDTPTTTSVRNGVVNANGNIWGKKDKTAKQKAADKARSLVLLLATLAATITYQAGLDPPGGVWQDNSGGHTAGDPILLTTNPRRYKAFFYCNSVSLVASLVAIVLAQKKFLFRHHVLEAVMILDLFGLIGAYAAGSCRDVNTSIHAMALAGAVLVYVVIHVIFITLDDDDNTHARAESDNKRQEKDDPVERSRKRLLLFAIFAATITYQAGLTPPGGFLHQDVIVLQAAAREHHAGDPVLLYNFPRRYTAFFYCNSVSFMLSIALIILLVNPNLYRPAIRTHALSVCTAVGLFGLMGAYAAGSTQHLKTSVYVFALIAVVLVCIAILFLVFLLTGGGGGAEAPATADSGGDTGAAVDAAGTQAAAAPPTTSTTSNATTAGQGGAISEMTNTQQAVDRSNKDTAGSTTQNNPDGVDDNNKTEHANRKYLMVLGILVASVTYQAGLQPPGGAWQSSGDWYDAGDPVLHDNRRHRYLAFFYSNSTSFMASVVVILLLLVPPERLFDNTAWRPEGKKWLVVMNTTIVLDLLGLLGAYAAGSSRRWKTSVYVLLLVIGVLIYMGFHLVLSCILRKRSQRAQTSGGGGGGGGGSLRGSGGSLRGGGDSSAQSDAAVASNV